MSKETLESLCTAPAAAGHIPAGITITQPGTLPACGQKSRLLFFSQPFLCLKWTFTKEKVRNEWSTGTACTVSHGQMCVVSLPNSLFTYSSDIPVLEDISRGSRGAGLSHFLLFRYKSVKEPWKSIGSA